MDESKDPMEEATYEYLLHATVHGARELTHAHMCDLLERNLELVQPHLASVSLPRLRDQLFGYLSRLPEGFENIQALNVYATGDEAWTDAELTERWFVGADGRWYWVKCDRGGGSVDGSVVTMRHLVDRVARDGEVSVAVLSAICNAFRSFLTETAVQARAFAMQLDGVTAALERGGSAISSITPHAW